LAAEAVGEYPVEEIPASATLFMRVPDDIVKGARLPPEDVPPSAFRAFPDPAGILPLGVSTNWDRYSDAQSTISDPKRFGVVAISVAGVRRIQDCSVAHTPLRRADVDNRAHAHIYGPLQKNKLHPEVRVKLARGDVSQWAIKVPSMRTEGD
jgi:hypothetical protein